MKKSILFLALWLTLGCTYGIAQGIIRGTVIEDATGEPMFGVTVVIQGTTTGASTDFDGKFEIKAQPGTYNLQVSFISYKTLIIENVEVKGEGKVTLIDNIRMAEDSEMLEEVVVTAEVLQTTEEALLTVKRKSVNLFDGISSASFRRIGDSNAASAVKRVPGVSIEGGKYVYVRGLGDRYTKSILNGVDIPGLDPDRNTLQMDIFPTNVIDNIIVIKAFTADLPADFTGGIVDIATKDFPDEKTLKISGGVGYNPDMHFNSDYLTYEGGNTDWLGFDDGSRDIPTNRSTDIPFRGQAIGNPQAAQEFSRIINEFNPTLSAIKENSFMDYSLGLSLGNQVTKNEVTLGYNIALSYKNETEFYQDAEYNRWGKGNEATDLTLDARELQKGTFGSNNVLLGGLAGFALKTKQSKFKLNLLHLQNGENKAGIFTFANDDQGADFEAIQHNLEFSERGITNILLNGEHYNSDATWKIEWKVAPTRSVINDPDIRFTRYRTDVINVDFTMGTESGLPERIWRYLEEDNLVGRLDVTREYKFKERTAKLKFGSYYTYKQRNYEIQNFQIFPGSTTLTGNPNELFFPENLWTSEKRDGVYYDPQFVSPVSSSNPDAQFSTASNPNKYDADIQNIALYVSNELSLSEKFKTILGVRAEQYRQRYSGLNQDRLLFDNVEVIDELDFFPSVNLIYSANEKQNLRFSFSRTIARPSFKEASFATIADPITGRTFIGGLFIDIDVATGEEIWDGNLTPTTINNLDVRWELFQKRGQTFAVSAFYKSFEDPIEIVQYVQASNNFQPRNVGDGQVIGVELEFRQSLEALSPALSDFFVNGNVTVTESQIEMSQTEFLSRQRNARVGEQTDDTRNMAGQAPYIINAGLSYANDNGWEAGVYYNVQGRTLIYVGIADRPDVFSVPFHNINLSINKSFGTDQRLSTSFKVDNLLGDVREQVFESFGTNDEFFTRLAPGTTFSFSIGYQIW